MERRSKIIILALVLIGLVIILAYLYFSNKLAVFGLCKPGMKYGRGGLVGRFCYTPSGYEGQSCNKKTDCGNGNAQCVVGKNETNGGVCRDVVFGCTPFIDNEGNIQSICID